MDLATPLVDNQSFWKLIRWLLFFGAILFVLSALEPRTVFRWPVPASLLLLTAGVTIASIWFMQRAVGLFDFRHMTIPGSWFLTFMVLIFAPTLPIVLFCYMPEGYGYALSEDLPAYGPRYLVVLLSGLVAVMLGIGAAIVWLRFRRSEIVRYFNAPIQDRGTRARQRLFLVLIAGAILPTTYYFATLSSPIAAVQMLLVPHLVDVARLREEAFSGITGPLRYFYALLSEPFYPYLISVGMGYYLIERRRRWFGLFLITAGFGLFFNISSAARGPAATIALVAAAYLYLHRGGRVSTRFLVCSLALILAFPIVVTILAAPAGIVGLLTALRIIVVRIAYAPAYVGYVYFRVFPNLHPHPYGGSVPILAWLFNLHPFNTGAFVHAEVFGYPYGFGTHEDVSAGGMFIAGLYGEFGMAGVWLGCFLAGFIMQALQIRLLREQKTVFNLAVYAYLFYAFWMLFERTLQTVLLSTGVFFVCLLAWMVRRHERRLRALQRQFACQKARSAKQEVPGPYLLPSDSAPTSS